MSDEDKLKIFFGWIFEDTPEDSGYDYKGKRVSVTEIKKVLIKHFPKLFYKNKNIQFKF